LYRYISVAQLLNELDANGGKESAGKEDEYELTAGAGQSIVHFIGLNSAGLGFRV
jgi:hypothetical protein